MSIKTLVKTGFIFLALALYTGVTGNDSYNLLPKFFALQGIAPSQTGFIMSFTGMGGMLVLPLLALFVDHFKQKRILTAALVIQLVVPLAYFLPLPFPRLFAVPRFIQGAMFATMMISFTAALSHVVPPGSRSKGYALFGIMGQLGGMTSVAIGEVVFDSFGLAALYAFTSVLFLCSVTFLQFYPEKKIDHGEYQPKITDFIHVFKNRKIYPALVYIFVLGCGFGTLLSFLPDLVLARGIDIVKPFYIAYPLTVALIRIALIPFFDKLPAKYVIFIPLLMVPVSLFTVASVNSIILLVCAGVFYGIAHGVLFPVLLGFLMDHSPANFRARMSLVFQIFFNLGLFISANLGSLFALNSVAGAFIGMGIITTIGIIILTLQIILQFRRSTPA
ncbi:MAG: MFS transporter [Spirochaetia bacterium]